MKIGIGVITVQNREIHPNILNLISQPTQFYIFTDHERKGPGFGRNECIKNLYDSGCDYIFMFDDDTYPVKKGWEDHIIRAATDNDIHCFGYPNSNAAVVNAALSNKLRTVNGVDYWQWSTGCFKFITRRFVEEVGYFNNEYHTYGFEDVGYLYRARASRLCGPGDGDPAPVNLSDYIFSSDIFAEATTGFDPYANMSPHEKSKAIDSNRGTFTTEVSSGKIYYPYDQ